jgi:hypothetical protein
MRAQAELDTRTTVSDASLDCGGRTWATCTPACMRLALRGDGFDDALAGLEASIHGSSQICVLAHNDARPHNFLRTPNGVRLLNCDRRSTQ